MEILIAIVAIFAVIWIIGHLKIFASKGPFSSIGRPSNLYRSDPHSDREGEKRHWLTTVVGVSFKNENGSDRQSIITRCREGEAILLIREPNNKFGPNAIRVCRTNGDQIGHIARDEAYRVADELDRGKKLNTEIAYIHPPKRSGQKAGVVVRIGVPQGCPEGAIASTHPNR
jgi:hypothetical protein